jgi:hypothetical protein
MLASDRGNARASGYAGIANAFTGASDNLLALRELERRPRYTGPYENRTAGTPTMNVPPYRTPPFNPYIPRTYGGQG